VSACVLVLHAIENWTSELGAPKRAELMCPCVLSIHAPAASVRCSASASAFAALGGECGAGACDAGGGEEGASGPHAARSRRTAKTLRIGRS